MNLNVSTRNGRTYLYIEKGYRKDGKVKKKRVKTIGYLDTLELDPSIADPIAHFRQVAKNMTEEEREEKKLTVSIDMEESLSENPIGTQNMGYMLPMKIYHELGIDKFLRGKAQSEDFKYNTNSIMLLLTISRLLVPGSIKRAFESKSRYFERFDFTDDDIYRAYDHFDKISDELQQYVHESVRRKYGCDTSIVYYDVTNYWFEIKKPDDFRKYGLCKQRRKRPIVQMGLAMDKNGIPLHYELFPGNKLDKETFRSVIGEVRKNYDTGRIVVVSDMGIITGDNIYYLTGTKPEKPQNGYIFSFSVRGGTNDFKKYVLDDANYADKDGNPASDDCAFKIKERFIARKINVTMQSGRTAKHTVYEKQIVFWSKKHFIKSRTEREEVLAKSEALIADPKKFTKATSYGAAAYVKNIEYDKESGEILTGKALCLDLVKIENEEKYDGYYSIVTSETHMTSSEIVDTYRGLWEIEETFRITKSDLAARPVYVRDREHINAHFLVCFLSLVILRIIQKKINRQYSAEQIIECLNKIECFLETENIFLFGYRSHISNLLGDTFNIDFTRKRLSRSVIKNFSASVKS